MGGILSHEKPEVSEEVLEATCGPVRGNVYAHKEFQPIDGYLGIPYAKPPVEELRFKKPLPLEVWSEVRDCTNYGPRAPQDDNAFKKFGFESETPPSEGACLTLNVFTPRNESAEFKRSRPVMVFIHGGGYQLGSSCDHDASSLAGSICQQDIVLVTINYRIGVLGFLTTGEDDCKGNYGLWDQTLALKWVQQHISSFGGDPDNVTVFGQSAGGGSVDLLTLCPHSRDLFHKVIPMSGNALCDFAIRTNNDEAIIFREYAKKLGWTGEDNKDLLQWYKSQEVETIQCSFDPSKEFDSSRSGSINFVPNIDGDFFPKPLDQLRKEAPKKPIMTGVTEFEGIVFAAMMKHNGKNMKENFDKSLEKTFRSDFSEDHKQIQEQVFDFYTKNIDVADEDAMLKQIIVFLGDQMFNHGTYDLARVATKYGNDVYLYSFDYFNSAGLGKFAGFYPLPGATHGTELRYVLGHGGSAVTEDESGNDELRMIEQFTQLLSNFAKYGNPNKPGDDHWQKYTLDSPERYYKIHLHSEMKDNFQGGRMEFWDRIRDKSNSYHAIQHGK